MYCVENFGTEWEECLYCGDNFFTMGIIAVLEEQFLYCGNNFCIVGIISVLWEQFLYCGHNFCTMGIISVLWEQFHLLLTSLVRAPGNASSAIGIRTLIHKWWFYVDQTHV